MKFIHNLSNAPSASTPHLYLSALPFAPENSLLVKDLRARFPCIARVAAGHHKEWPSAQILLQGHTSWARSVAFSPDGTRIVSGSQDKTVRVWDTERGVQIGSPLQGHTSYVTSVAFSPDGTRLVSGSDDNTVRVWNSRRNVQISNDVGRDVFQSNGQAMYSPISGKPISHFRDIVVVFNLIVNRRPLFLSGHDANQ